MNLFIQLLHKLGIYLACTQITQENFDKSTVPHQLQSSSLKRQMDFVAGRRAARCAINNLDPQLSPYVGIDSRALPIWPAGVTGSISHCVGWAVAAVASKKHMQSLGVDIELRSSSALLPDISHLILSPLERDLKQCPTALLRRFSAKESVYKCLFPAIQQFIDFNECTLEISEKGSFTSRLNKEFPGRPDLALKGLYSVQEEHLITLSFISSGYES